MEITIKFLLTSVFVCQMALMIILVFLESVTKKKMKWIGNTILLDGFVMVVCIIAMLVCACLEVQHLPIFTL